MRNLGVVQEVLQAVCSIYEANVGDGPARDYLTQERRISTEMIGRSFGKEIVMSKF